MDGISPGTGRSPASKVGNWIIDHPVPILVILALAGALWWGVSTRQTDHTIKAAFPQALNLFKGQDVQIDGVDAGKIGKVDFKDGQAIVELGINDDEWPLPRGTYAMVRYGTTLGNGTRFVQLIVPDKRDQGELSEDAVIPARMNVPPTEFDEMFNTFDSKTRADIRSFTKATGDTLATRGPAMNQGFEFGAPALEETAGLLQDLNEDDAALRGLIDNGHRATRVLGARKPEISNLVSVMSATFNAFATHSAGMRASLDRFAPTLRDIRGTLPRVDQSVDNLDGLVTDLGPGARALPSLVRDARPALSELTEALPLATSTLKTIRRGSPDIKKMLDAGQPFSRRLASTMTGLAPHVACIRPYAPDIASFFTNWASWSKNYDNISHYGRINTAVANAAIYKDYPTIKSSDFLNTVGTGLKYAMPQPPGYGPGGQTFFVPECGAGPDALDASKDPED